MTSAVRCLAALLTLWSLLTNTAFASQLALLAGGGLWTHPETGGHGLLLIGYDRFDLPHDGHLGAEFNTDTFRLSVDRLRFRQGSVELGFLTAAEVYYAGLLPDYYRDGKADPTRGFWASYLASGASVKLNLPGRHHLELLAGGRRWFFTPRDATDPLLTLPAETWVSEARLRYTLWRLRDDPSLRQRHRLFPRSRGLAIGLEFGLDHRASAHPWGARDPDVFTPSDQRNDPARLILLTRQWMRAGWQLRPRLRTQIAQWASWGRGEDDLTRMRVGGMNPYVVPIAGAPWAAYLSDRLLAASWSWHFRVRGEVEVGPFADAVLLADRSRTSNSDNGWLGGIGALFDGRFDRAQLDMRAGWNPNLGQFSLFLSAGYLWE